MSEKTSGKKKNKRRSIVRKMYQERNAAFFSGYLRQKIGCRPNVPPRGFINLKNLRKTLSEMAHFFRCFR